MTRATLVILLAALVLAVLVTALGCAPARQAVHADNTTGVSVRLPIVESPKVSLSAEEQGRSQRGPLSEPQSVGDEYRGRWLTVFEVTVTPPEGEKPREPAPEEFP